MLRAGKHLNSLHCVGMSTDSTQFGQLAHLFFFPTLKQPKTLSVFGEEAKNFLLMTLQSISIITHLFVSEKKHGKPSVNFKWALPVPILFFFEPAGHGSKFHAAAVYAMLDGWGPGLDPETDVMWNCSTADPSNWKNMLQNWTSKIIQMSVENKYIISISMDNTQEICWGCFNWIRVSLTKYHFASKDHKSQCNGKLNWCHSCGKTVALPQEGAERRFEHQRVSINAVQGVV